MTSACIGASQLPTLSQLAYVNKGGNDTTATGSFCLPFLTIQAAITRVSSLASGLVVGSPTPTPSDRRAGPPSPTHRIGIQIGPGTYTENVHLPANIFLLGESSILTRIESVDIAHPSWTVDQDSRSGLHDLQVLGTTTLDFVAAQSHQGKFYTWQTRFSDLVNMTGCNSINQLFLYLAELQTGLLHKGGDVYWFSSTNEGFIEIHDQVSNVNPIPGQQVDTRFFGSGGGFTPVGDVPPTIGDMTILNDTPNPGLLSHVITVYLYSFGAPGVLTVQGDNTGNGATTVFATADAIPEQFSISMGAVLNRVTWAPAIGYVPGNATVWQAPLPSTVQEAIDRLAQRLFELTGHAA